MATEIRVRYAPSPTGHLHIGNARTALFNYLFARKERGKFIIRIEDTDQKRNIAGGEESQLNYLRWLGIDWDESIDCGGPYGPYRQSERLDIYQRYYEELLAKGQAYYCYCTEEELEAEREAKRQKGEMIGYSGRCRHLTEEERKRLEEEGRQPSIRLKVPENRVYTWQDMVKGEVSFHSKDFSDFVIVKKDGMPTYNFAVAVDDHEMKITHVLRGDDHITNTPKQLMVYEALGFKPPQFGHMTLIVNEQRKKLSKRDETIIQFIEQYEELGYLPEALFNFIALLGWSPGGEEEIFSREELIEIFTPERLSKSPAVFDQDKLTWLNNHYIKQLSPDELVKLTLPHLQKAGYLKEELTSEEAAWVRDLVLLYQERLNYGAEIVSLTQLFFQEEITFHEEALAVLKEEHVPKLAEAFVRELEALEEMTPDTIKTALKNIQKATGYKGKQLFMPIRVMATGEVQGPDLNQSLALLGRDKVLSRIKHVLANYETLVN